MKTNPLIHLVIINFKNFFREPGALFWSLAFPIAMAWILGIAFSGTPVKKYKILISGDSTVHKIYPKEKTTNFTREVGVGTGISVIVNFESCSDKAINEALQKGVCILYIDLQNNQPVFHYDPGNQEAVNLYVMVERDIETEAGIKPFAILGITTKGNRYIDFLITGLLAMGIMNSCVWGIGWFLIELRIKKLLRRMVATPMKKSIFILSHFIGRLLLTLFESCVLFIFAKLFFDIDITGSYIALVFVYLSGILVFGGIGLILASRTQSTNVGNGLINAVVLPMTIVSGIFFSYEGFPSWMIPVIKILPLTILADSLRAIFNEGAGLAEIWQPCAILTFLGLVFYFIGLKIFKWY
jgi:ABC-2 type transport system permease protein